MYFVEIEKINIVSYGCKRTIYLFILFRFILWTHEHYGRLHMTGYVNHNNVLMPLAIP